MRVFTIFPPIHRKNIYAPELRELLSNGQAKTYARTQNDDDPLSKLFEDVRSSSLKEITRRAEDRALTALEAKALLEFKGKLFVCIREIANVKPGEQFWVVVTSETNFLFKRRCSWSELDITQIKDGLGVLTLAKKGETSESLRL